MNFAFKISCCTFNLSVLCHLDRKKCSAIEPLVDKVSNPPWRSYPNKSCNSADITRSEPLLWKHSRHKSDCV